MPSCENSDARLSSYPKGVAEYCKDDRWYPICGHYFVDNDVGADLICKGKGYSKGAKRVGLTRNLRKDAVYVGRCDEGDKIYDCTGTNADGTCCDGNSQRYQLGQGDCTAYLSTGVEVECEGNLDTSEVKKEVKASTEYFPSEWVPSTDRNTIGHVQCCANVVEERDSRCFRKHPSTAECVLHDARVNSTGVSYASAVELCNAAGLRLCTKPEVNAGVFDRCRSTGCGLDGVRVWVSGEGFNPWVLGAPNNADSGENCMVVGP